MYDQPVSQFSYAAFILRRVLYGSVMRKGRHVRYLFRGKSHDEARAEISDFRS